MAVERVTLPEQHYIYVDREAGFVGTEIADAMASGFGEIFTFCEDQKIERLAMPMTVYMGMPTGPKMTFRAAFLVSAEDAARAAGAVKSATIPAGDVFKATHLGAYTDMNETHQAIWSHMDSVGADKAWPVWEIYVDDPTTVPEAEVRTEVYRKAG